MSLMAWSLVGLVHLHGNPDQFFYNVHRPTFYYLKFILHIYKKSPPLDQLLSRSLPPRGIRAGPTLPILWQL
jgi:hypothetical protein